MTVAIWVIAICEVIKALQNALQIWLVVHDTSKRDNAYAEFVKSLHTDKEFVERMLKEFEEQEHD